MDVRLRSICLQVMKALDSPLSQEAARLIGEDKWAGLCGLSVNPRDYATPASYFRDACAVSLLKKAEFLVDPAIDRKGAALLKWKAGEAKCYRTNQILAPFVARQQGFNTLLFDEPDGRLVEFFDEVRKTLVGFIGARPPSNPEGKFGPGSTFETTGNPAVPDKISTTPTFTSGALWSLVPWYGTLWGSACAHAGLQPSRVPGNRFTTAPKTALTDRPIAVEPSINIYYQLAFGSALRSRLREKTGWDLNRAQDIHRRVACESSVTREFATLDLSNASDTLARGLVRLLLPRAWFEALNDLRSPKTLVEGKWHYLEKFSSMGNGFTFELETVVFAAIACTVVRLSGQPGLLGRDVFVFGDDIIVPDNVAKEVIAALRFCGFELNESKSFFGEVPFRESCGGDFFQGKAVRPYYLKKDPHDPQRVIAFANGINRLLENDLLFGEGRLRTAWHRIVDLLPSRYRLFGPKALGDQCVHDVQTNWNVRFKDEIRYIRVVRPVTKRFKAKFTPDVTLAAAIYGALQGGEPPTFSRRDSIQGFAVRWAAYS